MSSPSFRQVDWPVGPEYAAWVSEDFDTPRAWTMYKLRTASWYIDLLAELVDEYGFSRLAGIEMAFDGAVTGLSSAFDAAVAGLIRAAETRLSINAAATNAIAPDKTDPWRYKWCIAVKHLEDNRVVGDEPVVKHLSRSVKEEVEIALARVPQPGWLYSLRRLRNRAAHQDTLALYTNVRIGGDSSGTDVWLSVEEQAVEPIAYLRKAHAEVHQLTAERVLKLADRLAPRGSRPI